MSTSASPRSTTELLERSANGPAPQYLFFWGHRAPKDGRTNKSCLSQWFEAPFTVDGIAYRSAEHFMMAGKARLFGDAATCAQVLAAATPDQAKQLGRRVAGFNEATWAQARWDIVVAANQAKFAQNPALGQFLRDTGDQVLVEASPVDAVWGIGLAADHPDAMYPDRWHGLNLLGFALMRVRADLATEPLRG